MANHRELKPGTALGKCAVQDVLGKGGMGTVYKGYHEGLRSEVAIKVLHNVDELTDFFKEAKSIARLEHPNIMKIYDIEQDEQLNVHYIVAQLIPGFSLEELLEKRKNYQALTALRIMIKVAEGLAYAHKIGIIHRDIKPANIMIDHEEHVKITDFGLAYAVDVDGAGGKIMGTPHYMAPEQCRGEIQDARTDIYALGGTFYHLLAGHPAFVEIETLDELLRHQLYETPVAIEKINVDVPKNLAVCIRKMMAKAPDDRYKDCLELLEQFHKLEIELDKLQCPRCGKANSADEVFHCPRCSTKNLCLTHLVQEKQFCDHCLQTSKKDTRQQAVSIKKNWLEFLAKMYKNHPGGVLHIKNKKNSILLKYSPTMIQVQTKAPEDKDLSADESNHHSAIQHKLLKALSWKEVKLRYYPMRKESQTMPLLPPHPNIFRREIQAKTFLSALAGIVKLYFDISTPGALVAKGSHKSVGILYTETGVAIAQGKSDDPETFEFIEKKQSAEKVLEEIIQPDCNRLSFREISAFPPLRADLFFRPPTDEMVTALANMDWEQLPTIFPNVSNSLPNDDFEYYMEWDDLRTRRILHELSATFYWDQWQKALSLSSFELITSFAAIVKEELHILSDKIVDMIKIHKNKIPGQKLIPALEEGVMIGPDNAEIYEILAELSEKKDKKKAAYYFSRLGKITFATSTSQAQEYYQKAIECFSGAEDAKYGLLEIAHKKENFDLVKKIGLELLPLLRKQGESGEVKLEKVCEMLLEADKGMVQCRQELINIQLNRGNNLKAAMQYESLAQFYQQAGNKEQLTKAYQSILKLAPDREDIHKKLQVLNQMESDVSSEESFELELPQQTWRLSKKTLIIIIVSIVLSIWTGQREWKVQHRLSLIAIQLQLKKPDEAEKTLKGLKGFYLTVRSSKIKQISIDIDEAKKQLKTEKQKKEIRLEKIRELLNSMDN